MSKPTKSQMKNNYEFIFEIGQKVKIKDLNITGIICGIYISRAEIEYSVRYFYDGNPKSVYFSQTEIELVDDKDVLGFKPHIS